MTESEETSIMEADSVSLLDCIKNSSIEAVESLFKEETAKPEIQPEFLLSAIQTGCLEIIQVLLKNGVDANTSAGGKLLIYHAIDSGNPEIVTLLLNHGASLEKEKNHILVHAMKSGNLGIFERLVEKSVESGCNLERIMLYSVNKSKLEELGILLKFNKDYVQTNAQLLSTAIEKDLIEVTEFLLHNGANPNAEYKEKPNIPSESNLSKYRYRYRNRYRYRYRSCRFSSDTDSADSDSDTVLLHEPGRFINNCLQLLESSSILSHFSDRDYYLSDSDEDPAGIKIKSFKHDKGRTPLHFAVELDRREAVNLLLEHGADVNVKTEKTFTPLSIAANKGFLEIARILLDFGAAIDILDASGKTALHLAAKKGHNKLFLLLLNYLYDDFPSLCRTGIYGPSLFAATMQFLEPKNFGRGGKNFIHLVHYHFIRMKSLGFDFPENSAVFRHSYVNTAYASKGGILSMYKRHFIHMRSKAICGIPLFEILKKDVHELVDILRDETFLTFWKSETARTQLLNSMYFDLIEMQLWKGELMMKLLDQGLSVNNLLFNFVPLPEIVVDKILKNLNNRDIRSFISACKLCPK